jgi:hypothetical protein
MTISAHTQLLAGLFASNGLDANVALRLADAAQAAVTIWPYAADFDPAQRNQLPPFVSPRGPQADPDGPQRTHVLVLPATIEACDRAWQLIVGNPVLQSDGIVARVLIEPLPLADMAALFSASGVDYRVALNVVVATAGPPT